MKSYLAWSYIVPLWPNEKFCVWTLRPEIGCAFPRLPCSCGMTSSYSHSKGIAATGGCLTSSVISHSIFFLKTLSCLLIGSFPEADPEARIHVQASFKEAFPGTTRRVGSRKVGPKRGDQAKVLYAYFYYWIIRGILAVFFLLYLYLSVTPEKSWAQ